jgi:hypothetical protein
MLPAQRSGKSEMMPLISLAADILSVRWQRNRGSTVIKDRDAEDAASVSRPVRALNMGQNIRAVVGFMTPTRGHLYNELTLLQQRYILSTTESTSLVAQCAVCLKVSTVLHKELIFQMKISALLNTWNTLKTFIHFYEQ